MKAIDGKFTIPEREYPEHRQAILELMLKVRDMFNPDTVFIPSHNDTHQDHATVHQEAIRAFKRLNVYGYELPWNVMEGCPSIYSILEERHLDGKMELIRCYKSESHREYMQAGAVTAQMRFRGLQAGVQYAEAFYHYRTFWT
jgi:LmbE family N-acetylglucosaminyl deacetylase